VERGSLFEVMETCMKESLRITLFKDMECTSGLMARCIRGSGLEIK